MRFRIGLFIAGVSLFLPLVASAANPDLPLARNPSFDRPTSGRLKTAVDFWVEIYARVSRTEGLLHDAKYLQVVYETIDFKKSGVSKGARIRAEKERIRKILLSLHSRGVESDPSLVPGLKPEEKRIYDLFVGVDEPNKFLKAAHYKRLRFQLGQKESFRAGYVESGRYLPFMERVFLKKGLPFELTRLPFVESSFNTRARSKVGASGIWQFMPSTATNFIQVGDGVDERNDPLRATEAAAELLKINYDSLGNWPLAVTAYNHGRTSLMRATRRLGTTDLETIVKENTARGFGFASGNFFACLLAAIEVERNARVYFGLIEREAPHFFWEVELPSPILLKDLVAFFKLKRKDVVDLNPGFTSDALASREMVPQGYRLRLRNDGDGTDESSAAKRRAFLSAYGKIPQLFKGQAKKRKRKRIETIDD